MKINGSLFDPLRPTPSGTTAVQRPAQDSTAPTAGRSARSDSVQISDAGRKLAQREELDPERVAELRQKVLTGAYNTLDVVDQVARRILSRGDL